MKRIWRYSLFIVSIVLIDQFSKGYVQSTFHLAESFEVIKGFLNITYVQNPGAAFGILSDAPKYIQVPIFIGVPIIAIIWLTYLIWTLKNDKKAWLVSFGYALIFTGALGNLLDRLSYGYVVDFLDFHWRGSHFPAFNIADVAISISAVILLIDFFIELKEEHKNKNQTSDL